jgi:hypothetical protein
MEIVYCTQCGKVIPPGGVDEGKYYARGDDRICPACYRKTAASQHSGGTALVSPLEGERRSHSSRMGPAPRRKADSDSSAKFRALKAAAVQDDGSRTPTSKIMVAARKKSSGHSSARLRAQGARKGAGLWLLVILAAVAIIGGIILALAVPRSKDKGEQPRGVTPPAVNPGNPPATSSPKRAPGTTESGTKAGPPEKKR